MNTQAPREIDINTLASHVKEGRLEEALRLTGTFLQSQPGNAEIWYLKGVIHNLLSVIHNKMSEKHCAIEAFGEAVKYNPAYPEAWRDMALALEKTGQVMRAIEAYERLMTIDLQSNVKKPRAAFSATSIQVMNEWFYKGLAEYRAGRIEKSLSCYRKALAINPDMPESLANCGMMFYTLRRFDEAEKMLLHSLQVRPRYAEALNLLGNVYKDTNRPLRAVAAYKLALAAKPDFRHASINIGKVFYEMRNYPEAIRGYERTLTIDPGYVETLTELTHMFHLLCNWEKVDELQARARQSILTTDQCAEPFIFAVHGPLDLQRENARRWSAKLFPTGKPHNPTQKLPAIARENGKLRIGYLSADFHRHATAALISEMFEHHDRGRFEIFAYSYGMDDKGPERARVIAAVDAFHELRTLDDHDALDLMRKGELDILVDLKGYTQGHRLGLLGPRPAPVQIHYLGHPGTTGAPFVDYFVADSITAPWENNTEFSEQLIRLPHSYQINDRSRPLPKDAPPRAFYGLPQQGFVFCDFNNPYKITAPVFAVWMRLLKAVPGSVLWLYETHPEATDNMRREMTRQGVDPARLIVARPTLYSDHLARYHHVDLFVDTSPVCGHTTTSDALWCAVPIVTIMQNSFISRVAASLLSAVGLPELCVSDLASYEALALELAHDAGRRQRIKRHLQEGRMKFPLFDSLATTRALEAAFIHAADRQRRGLSPQGFSLCADLSIAE